MSLKLMMVNMLTHNDLDLRWSLLVADPLRMIFQLYDANHKLDLYLGKSAENKRLLMYISIEQPPKIKDLKSIKIRSYKREDGKWTVLFLLDSIELESLFTLLCYDLIESSRNIKFDKISKLHFLLKRLSSWRKLFEKGFSDLLTENEVRGLCGELLFLDRLISYLGPDNAVNAWVGPLKADQDFQSSTANWEIKTIRPSAEVVNISSEKQLETNGHPTYLTIYTLKNAETIEDKQAFTLNMLVEKIKTTLAVNHDAYLLFEEKIFIAEYAPRIEYDQMIFIDSSVSMFDVSGDFPKISNFDLRKGVNNVSYNINLSACNKFIHESPILSAGTI